MKNYNYKRNLKLYKINMIVFLSLLVVLGNKLINTTKIYAQYKEGKEAYAQGNAIATQRIYTDIRNKTTFHYFSREIKNVLKTDELIFIKESIIFLEDIKDKFIIEMDKNELVAMLDIHNAFDAKLAEVSESLDNEKIANYNILVDNYNLKSLFLTEFENIARRYQQDIDNSIKSGDFSQALDFKLYSQILEKIIPKPDEKQKILEQDMKKYYVASVDKLIKEDNLDNLLVETQQIINNYSSIMEVGWMIDRATRFTAEKMEKGIRDQDYSGYRTLGSRYFTYLSQLPPELSKRNEIKDLVNNQLESDYKKTQTYITSNKFEEAKQMYDGMEEYIVIADNTTLDMERLNQDIDTLWMKSDPIRMFSPLVLTEISKGKAKWGREAYVLARDENRQTLYWGEVDSEQQIIKLELDISAYDVGKISISEELSTASDPVIMIEQIDGHGSKIYSAYRVERDKITSILEMNADYFDVQKQGAVLIGHHSNQSDINYYELRGTEYVNVFDLGDIEIEGLDEYGSVISGPKNTYSSYDVDAVKVYATISQGYNNNSSVQGSLGVSYTDPYGSVLRHAGSGNHYTFPVPVNTSDTEQINEGLRSDYGLGVYKVAFWWDGIKIAESQFTITE